jgi:hypothetical protein
MSNYGYHFFFRFRDIPNPISAKPNKMNNTISQTLRKAIATPHPTNMRITRQASNNIGKLIVFINPPLFYPPIV